MLRQTCNQYIQLSIHFEHQVIDHLVVPIIDRALCGYIKKPYEWFHVLKKFNFFYQRKD